MPLSLLLVQVSAHGNMKLPYIWQDTAMQGVTTRRTACVDVDLEEPSSDYPNIDGTTKCQNSWFTNHTVIPGEQTIPESMVTPGKGTSKRENPWFAPGTAPVYSSAQRVGFFNIGSGRVGYWTKYRVSLLVSGIFRYFGY